MSKLEALQDLLAKCEVGDHITYDDTDKVCSMLIPGATMVDAHMFMEGCRGQSMDAAKVLHEAVLPEWRPRIELGGFNEKNMMRDKDIWTVILWHTNPNWIHSLIGPTGQSNSPARAWACAILKTLIAIEGDK